MFGHFKSMIPGTEFIRQLISNALNKLNLVTRHEFEVQTQVLLKTRLRVEQLEQRVVELLAEQQRS